MGFERKIRFHLIFSLWRELLYTYSHFVFLSVFILKTYVSLILTISHSVIVMVVLSMLLRQPLITNMNTPNNKHDGVTHGFRGRGTCDGFRGRGTCDSCYWRADELLWRADELLCLRIRFGGTKSDEEEDYKKTSFLSILYLPIYIPIYILVP